MKYGIVQGYEDGTFRPNANITRQQAMAMIARAAAITELGGATTADLSKFADNAKVGAWAKSYVEYNVANGLIQGNSSGYLNPQANISRAPTETAVSTPSRGCRCPYWAEAAHEGGHQARAASA